jgi:hypothetical protein
MELMQAPPMMVMQLPKIVPAVSQINMFMVSWFILFFLVWLARGGTSRSGLLAVLFPSEIRVFDVIRGPIGVLDESVRCESNASELIFGLRDAAWLFKAACLNNVGCGLRCHGRVFRLGLASRRATGKRLPKTADQSTSVRMKNPLALILQGIAGE